MSPFYLFYFSGHISLCPADSITHGLTEHWLTEDGRNAQVSAHQLIIHHAFKACAAFLRCHGNCRAQLPHNGGPSLRWAGCAVTAEDHQGAGKSFLTGWSLVALSYLTGKVHVSSHTDKCINTHTLSDMWSPTLTLDMCSISLTPPTSYMRVVMLSP